MEQNTLKHWQSPPYASQANYWQLPEVHTMTARLHNSTMPTASGQNKYFKCARPIFRESFLRSTTRAAEQVNNRALSQISPCTQPFSPPVWPRLQFRRSRDDPVPFRDPRERSPPLTRSSTSVKERRITNTDADYEMPKSPEMLKVETMASGSMSIDNENIRNPPIKYTRLTSLRPDLILDQCELFQTLEDICTAAAGNFWRCQIRSAYDRPRVLRSSTNHSRNYRHFDPYARSTQSVMTINRYADQQESELSLMDYLLRITDKMWKQTKQALHNSEKFELIHRIGNLFSWSEKVMAAARREVTELDTSQEAVLDVVMAARDLTSWFLCEDGKREIDKMCKDIWGIEAVEIG